ncbi:NAD(P)-binding protein [Poronia punctata]|nr:NAD(P)-binding protein [Poronia punctata]
MSSTPSTIFLTGATGFIGAHAGEAALKAGYRVKLSIRRAEQQQKLEKLYASYLDQLEFAIVPDLTDVDSVREALTGVDYVWHLASPMPVTGADTDVRKDYVEPAVRGTLAMLEAARAHRGIEKVIVMGSILSLKPMGSFSSTDLVVANTGEVLPVDLDMEWPGGILGENVKYHASKILAHQEYRDWLEENKPSYNVFSYHPCFVVGPDLWQDKADSVAGVNNLLWLSLQMEQPLVSSGFIDVRDVALALLRGTERDIPTGKEYLLAGDKTSWTAMAEFVKSAYPDVKVGLVPPMDRPVNVDNGPAEQDLGMKWRPMEDFVGATVEQQLSFRA